MLNGKRIIVVMPAYNAESTLTKTYEEVMAQGIVDGVIIVDDASRDRTMEIAATLPETIAYRRRTFRIPYRLSGIFQDLA